MRHDQWDPRGPGGRLLTVATVAAMTLACLVLSGCTFQDAECSDGEYPAAQVDGPGSYCVPDGQEPDPGFVRYPAGRVPRHVGDEWDVYWQSHRLDAQGNEIPDGPRPAVSVAVSPSR
ncbi:lipoprotein [Actinoplanes sp. SE50]|uniref:SCO0607 family lipoprotein n=1 Tax=unclassified Actinoplanes TaxID=2626549 RepID=UPI00023ED304|nr:MULTISPECIES: hypothetical protein [unclassified Actinoplanes]AEV87304.1 lipoprotein [Actinoplanes sp. SE50/110]ATO85704.1 lipoprotein [Actinoplanes sp. SE50]SLM03117.1 lipoprotein [Actinoplanes sp. SE50/110]